MKKIIKFLLVIVMVLVTFTCTSCGEKAKSEDWDKFFKKLNNANNLTVEASIEATGIKYSQTNRWDKVNKMRFASGVASISPTYYVTNTDGKCVTWMKVIENDKEVWTSLEYSLDFEEIFSDIDVGRLCDVDYACLNKFDKNDFSFNKNKFYLKQELCEKFRISEMTVDFAMLKNECVIKIVEDADTFRESTITITISKLNKTKIDLPDEIKKGTK